MDNDIMIFSKINQHMVEGLMIHDGLHQMFLFLNLCVFADQQEEQYKDENRSYRLLNKYYITHRNMLINSSKPDASINPIPEDWYQKNRFDVSSEDIKKAVSYAINLWVDWERKTKELYTDCYNKLMEYGFAAEANFISGFITEVDEELARAESLLLELEAMRYDVIEIVKMNEIDKHGRKK